MPAINTTPETLKEDFETLIDDSLDEDYTYRLMSQAMWQVDSEIKPVFLDKQDTSQTASPGDTYTTKKTVPTDFLAMRSLYVGTLEYFQIAFERAVSLRDTSRRFYIDFNAWIQGNAALGLTGSLGAAQTITQNYTMKQAAITTSNKSSASAILWPDHWREYLPYRMAQIYRGNVDPDEIAVRASGKDEDRAKELLAMIENENTQLRVDAMGGQTGYAEDEPELDVGLL